MGQERPIMYIFSLAIELTRSIFTPHQVHQIPHNYIDEDYKLQTVLGALTPLKGAKDGETQAAALAPVLHTYDIDKDIVGLFVMDYATNNDTTLKVLAKKFKFNPVERRLCCLGHSKYQHV
jgi:hypothetical protein